MKGGWIVLKVSGVSKSYEAEEVLRDVSFVLNRGEKVGLVGPNGAGKSTLLRLLAGLERPDAGSVRADPSDRVAYLPQYPAEALALSVRDALLRGAGRVGLLQERIGEMERRMPEAAGDALDRLLQEYAAARDEYEALGGYALDARLEAVVAGLELRGELDAPVAALSGGNKTKLGLASLLLSGASILLLDEPTNYLDLPALLWLEDWVRGSAAACVVVSHDRRFMDRTVSGILELDLAEHTLRAWPGNYSAYAEAKRAEEEKRLAAYLDQQAERRRIEDDIRRTKEQARGVELGTNLDTARRYAKKVAKKAKAREHRLERMLEENVVEKPRRSWGMDLGDLRAGDRIDDDRTVLEVRGLHAGYGGEEVLRGVDLHLRGRDRVALLGANGSGKSTLLRCIAGRLSCSGEVRLGAGVRPGALSQEADELPAGKTVLEAFRSRTVMYEDEARTFLHKFLFAGEQVLQTVGSLSYGQRAKLALAILISGDANFLVLDEPTSHLDMRALEAVEEAIAAYVGPLLIVSHDRYFLERIGVTRTLVMDGGAPRTAEGIAEYEEELRSTAVG